jgi:hypothetical protein
MMERRAQNHITVAAGVLACRRGRASRRPDQATEFTKRFLHSHVHSAGWDATAPRQARRPLLLPRGIT